MVLIINPRVGLTVVTSSFMICLTMVVFPALSRPLHYLLASTRTPDGEGIYSINIRISLSFRRAFRNMESILQGWSVKASWLWTKDGATFDIIPTRHYKQPPYNPKYWWYQGLTPLYIALFVRILLLLYQFQSI